MPWRTYQNYELQKRDMSASALYALAKGHGWNPTWLLMGEGPQYIGIKNQDIVDVVLEIENHIESIGATIEKARKANIIAMAVRRKMESNPASGDEIRTWIELSQM